MKRSDLKRIIQEEYHKILSELEAAKKVTFKDRPKKEKL